MKRKVSICIIIILIILILFGVFRAAGRKPDSLPENTQTPTEAESVITTGGQKAIRYAYIVRARDGELLVYLEDGKTEYMTTGIQVETLQPALQEQAEKGIGFADSESLYDFLESYSS